MSGDVLSIRARIAFPGFDLDVEQALQPEGITAVFGPSGGGKSTLLRLIAGFERPRTGRIALGDAVWFDDEQGIDVPAYRRPVGYMFQDGRLFAHLTVRGNLEFADRRSRGAHERYTFGEIVDAFALEPLLDRRIGALSGGEQQRVALGRTLLTRPDLLLLDEPLAALDRTRKHEIVPYLEALPGRFGVRTLYVSHDLEEVGRLARDILVLADGRVRAHGPAADVIGSLDLHPLAGVLEAGSLLEGRVIGHDARLHLTRIDLEGDSVSVALNERLRPGELVRLRILARDVAVATRRPDGISIRNILPGTIAGIVSGAENPHAEVLVDLRSGRIRASLTRAAVEDLALAAGVPVFVLIKSASFEGRLL